MTKSSTGLLSQEKLIKDVDDLLPQTQCGLCGYSGCLPYAQALVDRKIAVSLCVPGGQPVADQIAVLLNRPLQQVVESELPLGSDHRPVRLKARIIEESCIGCTKCLVVCPTDAIIGTGKMMHSVLESDCTGCELCASPCPVDCIEFEIDPVTPSPSEQRQQADKYRNLYQRHLLRQQQEKNKKLKVDRFTLIVQKESIVTGQNSVTKDVVLPDRLQQMQIKSRIGKLRRMILSGEDAYNTLQQELLDLEKKLVL